jgi:hypothetical protein
MNAEATLKMIQEHPLTQTLLAEQAAETLAARQQTAARLAALKQEAAETLPELEQEAAALRVELETLDRQRLDILDRQRTAAARLMAERQRYDRAHRTSESELIDSADPRINEAIQFFRDEYDALRRKAVHKDARQGKRNLFTMRRQVVHFTNHPAIVAALEYCRQATVELEALKLVPAMDTERIEALKASIPDADAMSEYTGDKMLDPGPLAPGRHCFPLDSEYDAAHRRLMAR